MPPTPIPRELGPCLCPQSCLGFGSQISWLLLGAPQSLGQANALSLLVPASGAQKSPEALPGDFWETAALIRATVVTFAPQSPRSLPRPSEPPRRLLGDSCPRLRNCRHFRSPHSLQPTGGRPWRPKLPRATVFVLAPCI